MKNNVLILALSVCSLSVFSQKKQKDPFLKYDKVYYMDKTEETENYTVKLNNVIDYKEEMKFSFKVINNQSDYILIKATDSKITKVGKDFPISEKTKIIAPQKSKFQTIRTQGGGANRAKSFTYFSNSIYRLKTEESAQNIDAVKIPLARKDFSFNDVKCIVEVKEKKTQSSKIVTTIVNNSKDYLFIYASRVALKMPDGNEYASMNDKEVIIVEPNETTKVTYKWDRMPGGRVNDMQLVVMDLLFKDVFYFAKPESMEGFSLNVEWDEGLTDAKK